MFRGGEFELVVVGVAEHDGGVRPVRPPADAGVPDVELVEPVDPGLQRRAVSDLERDVVEPGAYSIDRCGALISVMWAWAR